YRVTGEPTTYLTLPSLHSTPHHLVTPPSLPFSSNAIEEVEHSIYVEGSFYLGLSGDSIFKICDILGHSPRYQAESGSLSCGLSVNLRFSNPHFTGT
ncbi:MAG: hypothetical protein LBF22_07000, partial [Deltaproteobacteria bacterium]|nr:hypothetical protein [Deltaproteobacteria bacterium]